MEPGQREAMFAELRHLLSTHPDTADRMRREAVESTLSGPEIEIAFNPQFLLDGLGAVGTPYSRLSFTQPSRPAVLSGQDDLDGDADTSYRYVLMPVRFAS